MMYETRDEAEKAAKALRKKTRGRMRSTVMQSPSGSWYLRSRDQHQYDSGYLHGKNGEPQRLNTVSYASGYRDGKVVREQSFKALEDHVKRKAKTA